MPGSCYSVRNAASGSMRAARRAGMYAASRTTSDSSDVTAAMVGGSAIRTPTSDEASSAVTPPPERRDRQTPAQASGVEEEPPSRGLAPSAHETNLARPARDSWRRRRKSVAARHRRDGTHYPECGSAFAILPVGDMLLERLEFYRDAAVERVHLDSAIATPAPSPSTERAAASFAARQGRQASATLVIIGDGVLATDDLDERARRVHAGCRGSRSLCRDSRSHAVDGAAVLVSA